LNEVKLTIAQRQNFFLIFKEAVNNLVKYSNATRVYINLSFSKNLIVLIIRDNGIGFDTGQRTDGNGLNNMKRRAKEMNAEFKIESGEENGTEIKLMLKK
jgi:signal transduction histidine kinase